MSGDDAETSTVELYIYDLTGGMAKLLSPSFGLQIDGVWHTSIVAYGREYFFGNQGISCCLPGASGIGSPLRIEKLGDTQIPYAIFIDFLNGLSETSYLGTTYDLFQHNCNNFSEELAQFLCGQSIPAYILDLPNQVLSTPIGKFLQPHVEQLQSSLLNTPIARARSQSPSLQALNQQIDEARKKSQQLAASRNKIHEKLARRERKKGKRPKLKGSKDNQTNGETYVNMTDPEIIAENGKTELANEDVQEDDDVSTKIVVKDIALELEREEKRELEEKKRARDPPIVFKDAVDVNVEFDKLVGLIDGKLDEEEQRSLEELHQYVIEDEGSWALSENFLNFVGRLLHDKSLTPETRVRILNVLAVAALKDDVILLLHQDRREHIVMNYAFDIDRHTLEEQQALALLICNLFENLSSSEWLMYISEWTFCNQPLSNIRVLTKVTVHALLSDDDLLKERGIAIMYNLACKEVFDDVAVELTMALLQYFQSKPTEEQLFRCMKALARLTLVSGQDVPQLIQMIGPPPAQFKGVSERVDEQIDIVVKKLR